MACMFSRGGCGGAACFCGGCGCWAGAWAGGALLAMAETVEGLAAIVVVVTVVAGCGQGEARYKVHYGRAR